MTKLLYYSNRDKIILSSAVASFLLNFMLWLLIAYSFRPSSEPVSLHYNIYFSIDQFGLWYQAYWMPLWGFFIFLVNTLLGVFLYTIDMAVSYFLLLSSVFLQVILLFAGVLIITYA